MKYRDAGFIFTAIFIALLIAGGSYFFLFSPALDARAEALASVESAHAFNDTLEIQLLQKQAEADRLPEYREQIAEVATQLPPRDDLAQVRRDLNEIMEAESVTITLDSANPVVVVEPGGVSLAEAAYAVGRTSYVEGLEFHDVYQTQLSLTMTGNYANVIRAVARLQMHDGRYYLVSGFDLLEADRQNPDVPATVGLIVNYFTLIDFASAIDPGSNSGNFDPVTGERVPPAKPGDALLPLIDPS